MFYNQKVGNGFLLHKENELLEMTGRMDGGDVWQLVPRKRQIQEEYWMTLTE